MTEPTNEPTPAPVPAPAPRATRSMPALEAPELTAYSPEYIKDLREENKGWRLKASEQENLRKEADALVAQVKKEAEDVIKAADEKLKVEKLALESAANERVIRAEVRAAAIKAGINNPDDVKLADLSALKLDEKGEVVGVDELMAKLKEAKPYLFGDSVRGTSNPAAPPKPTPPNGKAALAMSDAEWKAKLSDIDAGRRVS